MPVIHETDRRFDELGAAISRRFMDVNGKVEVTRNPPDRDPYQGDGRSALVAEEFIRAYMEAAS